MTKSSSPACWLVRPETADLVAAGYDHPSIDVLRGSGTTHTAAVPVLVRWLPRTEPYSGLQETVVRALTVSSARPAAVQPLLELSGPLTEPTSTCRAGL